jgi:hypothetical protein
MSTPGRCGLCNVESMSLQSSPWGQVCRPCLGAKSRAARRGAPVAVPSQEARDEALREEGRQEERAEVVAWYRARARWCEAQIPSETEPWMDMVHASTADTLHAEADRIERGEHLKEGA